MKAQCRSILVGLEPSGVGSAWAGAVSGRNYGLTLGERAAILVLGSLKFLSFILKGKTCLVYLQRKLGN